MCRGLALGLDKATEEIVCNGNSSHTDTFTKAHDSYVALELLRDDTKDEGYVIEVDSSYMYEGKLDSSVYDRHCVYLTKAGRMKPKLRTLIKAWEVDNQVNIFRWLLKCGTYATIGGNQYNNRATIKGDQYNDHVTIEGSQYNGVATIKWNQDNDHATIEGGQYNDHVTIKGNQDNNCATIGGDIWLTGSKILTEDSDVVKRDRVNQWIKDNSNDGLKLSNIIDNLMTYQIKDGSYHV